MAKEPMDSMDNLKKAGFTIIGYDETIPLFSVAELLAARREHRPPRKGRPIYQEQPAD